MKTRILLALMLLLMGTLAFAQKSVPTCNGFDSTGVIPMYFAPASTTGTTLCTDYFGKANYANSPLPAGPVDVSATGFTIVNGGSGYSTTPTVTISDAFGTPTATGAACSAGVTAGVITAITCTTAGSGYVAPLVTITDATGTGAWVLAKVSVAGPLTGGIRKFVDSMPDLKGAIAGADTTSFPGSDYYEIALVETTWAMHADLPLTTVRGYVQVPSGSVGCPTAPTFNYLGPVIVASKNRPVRVKFTNCLPTGAGGNLFIPVDNTYMGAGVGPDGVSPYLENRATLHLHGGNSPWISDGTPHQWTIPAGESSTYARGDSTRFVPDMFFDSTGKVTPVPQCSTTVTANCWPSAVPTTLSNDPGQGSMTFYWTNQQGGRLMFYHDHAYGITRLNVYAGEAAGYYLYDPTEESALAAATAPGTVTDLPHLIPLVIQDKTFVPNSSQLAGQDPTWIWGTSAVPGVNGNGDLWFPHVYMPNQNPADAGAANAFGRWDYGAWFFPPQTTLTAAGSGGPNADPHGGVTIPCTSAAFPNQVLAPSVINNYFEGCPIIPNPSGTPEGFMDTPLVNGKAYPILHVAPEAYRFQILAAGNDRSWNLQLYVADSTGKEVPMLPAVPPSAGTALPLCGSVTQITQPALGLGLPMAALDATGNPLNGDGLPANCWPNYGAPTPGIPSKQFMWPADGRDGGVPDPRYAGPPIIQIGTEGGLLPAPAVIPSTPVGYEVNTKSITITNISTHGLWLGPAERADVIVDFSQAAARCAALGAAPCTLILYNDAPTPVPAFDLRDDYYTGDLDATGIGGAPPTLPGYGPNTRTIMQIVVDGTPSATTAFNLASLRAALPAIFAATQPAPIVPEPTYPVASGGNAAKTTYARISDRTMTFAPAGQPVTSISVTAGGTGYSATTTVNVAAPSCAAPCATALATPTIVGGVITAITVTNGGSGYAAAPLVTFSDPTNAGTGAIATANLLTTYTYDQKAIQELFTLDYGRMNATLGTELPLTSFQLQTTLPFGYTEWPTEIVHDGDTQMWYLTHNGVDTHFIHFHLFNVQVINRIGWDGSLRVPDQNELGWKDTVRMNPLENIVVAVRPITPILPWPLPDSIRLLDVTLPDGVVSPAISGIDPATGNAIPGGQGTINAKVNFGWEYVWHCHILGHEENDMMRPITFQVAPPAPSLLTAQTTATGVNLAFVDNSASETSFTVQKDTDPTFPNPTTIVVAASSPNTAFGGTMTDIDPNVPPANTNVYYRARAEDNFFPTGPLAAPFIPVPMSSAWSNTALATPAYPTTMVLTTNSPITYGQNGLVTVTVTAPGGPVVTGQVTLTVDGVALAPQMLDATGSTIFTVVLPVVGTHNLVANYAAQGIFLASTASGTLLVNPATLTIAASPAAMPYGGPLPAFSVTATGLVPPDTLASLSFNQVCTTTAIVSSPVGTYPIDCSTSTIVAPNYIVIYVPGTLTVTPVPLTITANNAIKNYGQTVTFLGTEFTVTGLLNGDTVASVTLTSAGAPATAAVGSYPIVPSAAVGTGLTNYTVAYINGTLTVNPIALTITAKNAIKTYGQTVTFMGTEFTATGLLNGNTVTSVTLTSAGALATATVGAYPIVPSAAVGTGLTNYTITYINGSLTVNPAALTITANNAIKNYGQTVTFVGTAFTAAGLLNGNTVTSVTLTSVGAPATAVVGTYPIVPSAAVGTGLTNYTIAYVNGTLTVNRAALTITANPATRVWGFANPAFTVAYTGFVNGDTAASLGGALVCSSTATPTSALGTYPINCSGQTSTNYTIAYVAGTLTVTTAVQLTPASLTFATQNIGTTSPSQPATLRNIGGATMTFVIALTGDFVRGGGCGTTLAAGATCTVNVRFRPTATGVRTGTLTVTSALAGSGAVALSGTGNGAVAAATPASNNFGGITRGQVSAPFAFTITNNGTSVLTFTATGAFTLGGTNANQFLLTTGGSCVNGGSLAPLASCTFSVTFRPRTGTALGTKTATVRVRSNATNGAQTVTVAGTAQ